MASDSRHAAREMEVDAREGEKELDGGKGGGRRWKKRRKGRRGNGMLGGRD